MVCGAEAAEIYEELFINRELPRSADVFGKVAAAITVSFRREVG